MRITKSIVIFLLSFVVISCGGNKKEEIEYMDLVGEWERIFERNGSVGMQTIEFTPTFEILIVEVGDYLIMSEWYSGIGEGDESYRFIITPPQQIANTSSSSFSTVESAGEALIQVVETNEEVRSWAVIQPGLEYSYQILDDGGRLFLSVGELSAEYTRI